MNDDSRLFEVITPVATAAARRLTTVAAVTAIMEEGDVPANAEVEDHILTVSDKLAEAAGLAKDAAGHIPTFASETLRATFYPADTDRGTILYLPWRVPVTSITTIVENGISLAAGTDFILLPGARLLRMSTDTPVCWSSAKIIVNYLAGWASALYENAPSTLRDACAEQVKYRILARETNKGLRSYTVNDIRSETFNVPGGDTIDKDGLLAEVSAAIDQCGLRNNVFA